MLNETFPGYTLYGLRFRYHGGKKKLRPETAILKNVVLNFSRLSLANVGVLLLVSSSLLFCIDESVLE